MCDGKAGARVGCGTPALRSPPNVAGLGGLSANRFSLMSRTVAMPPDVKWLPVPLIAPLDGAAAADSCGGPRGGAGAAPRPDASRSGSGNGNTGGTVVVAPPAVAPLVADGAPTAATDDFAAAANRPTSEATADCCNGAAPPSIVAGETENRTGDGASEAGVPTSALVPTPGERSERSVSSTPTA